LKTIIRQKQGSFTITNDKGQSFEGISIPLSLLPEVIKGFASIVVGERHETEKIKAGFFDDHLLKENQVKLFFFVQQKGSEEMIIWCRDDAKRMLEALRRFQDTNKEQIIQLSWPQND